MENKITNIDELTHHGIKGQKWGIRRFQNKDGSLTAAGHKRRAKLEGELEKLGGKKGGSKSNSDDTPKKKTVSEMTDDELRAHTNRMQLESNYYNAQKSLASANPRQVSKGEKFMNGLMNDVVAPAAKSTGKAWLEKFMKDKLHLNDEDPLKKLENKYKKLEWEKKIKDIQKDADDDDDLVRALEFFRNTSADDRQELKDAASMYENLDKIRKKGKPKD